MICSVFALCGNVSAQFVGGAFCGNCHTAEYGNWSQHGHPWMDVPTGGANPPPSTLFNTIGVAMPTLPAQYKQGSSTITLNWGMVTDIIANYKETDGSAAAFLLSNGDLVEQNGTATAGSVHPMPARCNKCHETGFTNPAPGTPATGVIQGTWALPGIQCEQCHGPGGAMKVPTGDILNGLCRDCHSSGDSQYRIPFSTSTNLFNNHHPQGDEYRRSPHKNNSCTSCHDPHKSVWHNKGGVNVPAGATAGTMCIQCHEERVSGTMGSIGIECTQCHMPDVSAGGTRSVHLFRINNTPLVASGNLITQNNDSGVATKYWMNMDGTTSPNGDSFLTLDLVCYPCHKGQMNMQQLANAAQLIHTFPEVVDIKANGVEPLISVRKTQTVSIDLSITAGSQKGVNCNWWVSVTGPQGHMSWNGSKWVKGTVLWKKNTPLTDVPSQNVLKGKLATPGLYSYSITLIPQNGTPSTSDTVQVLVTK